MQRQWPHCAAMHRTARNKASALPATSDLPDRLIPVRATCALVGGISRTTLWRWTKLEDFPQPATIAGRHLWSEREVLAWIHQRLGTRPSAAMAATTGR